MAGLADIVRRDVIDRLSRRRSAVVAGGAGACRRRMVEVNRGPIGRYVTIGAYIAAWNMTRGLAGRTGPIVTRGAGRGRGGVIEMDGRPIARDVAILAVVAAWDMGRRLARRYGASDMARRASSQGLAVVEPLDDVETGRLMARRAQLGGRHMEIGRAHV